MSAHALATERSADAHRSVAAKRALRVGVDVGGTFTKAVALEASGFTLRAQANVPTTHTAVTGVTQGVVDALGLLLAELDAERDAVDLVAFSTTQAMNALLEGDVALVGVIGIGAAPDVRRARKRTRVGEILLAPGRSLRTEHEFIDATRGIGTAEVDAAVERLAASGCTALAVSGAFAVDAPEQERLVVERAALQGLSACAGHELTGAYGLETRTVSAAINAAILPVVERTATLVRRGLVEAGVDAPLLVLRGDGGAMSTEAFRRRPSFTVGSGPAAGVAAALHAAKVADAIVVECGGTSTNVSVVKHGRPVLRSIKVMGRPTAIRSIDSWVVGAAGGSMTLLGRRGLAEVGPRSAHLAGLPYATFADPRELAGAEVELIAPQAGDPDRYAVVTAGGTRFAPTATCAANALGLVPPGEHAHGSREAALAAFAPLAGALRVRGAEAAARAVLDAAIDKIALAVEEAAGSHDLGDGVPLVALGGSSAALVPALAERLGRPIVTPEHAEVLSSVGAATSLVRVELARVPGDARHQASTSLASEAEHACVESGAAPETVAVETRYDADEGLLRAVATGAVALEAGAAGRRPVSPNDRRRAAGSALGNGRPNVQALFESDFYSVYGARPGERGPAAVVDALGAVSMLEPKAEVVSAHGSEFPAALAMAVERACVNLGITEIIPRVTILAGPRLLDASHARTSEEVLAAAREAQADHPGPAAALIAR